MGTLVNSDSTSKDTVILLSKILSLLMVDTKWAGLFNVKSVLPVKGNKMLAKKADKSYAKVLTHDTIGLRGMSALWIFGKP